MERGCPCSGEGGALSKLRSVQALRAVAAVAVVIHHAVHEVAPDTPARVGAAGVDLFFVISGFIMVTVASRRPPVEFLNDRIWRIFPLWIVAVMPWLIKRQPDLPGTMSSLTLWPIYGNDFHVPALGVGWSLCFELLFYCAFALALARLGAIPACIFAACLCISPFSNSMLIGYLGSPLILEFLAGAAIARLPFDQRVGAPLLLVGIACIAIAPVDYYANICGPGTFSRFLYWGVPAALIVYGARSLDQFFDRAAFDLPVFLGNASYSIYLFHPLVVGWGIYSGIVASLIFGVAMHVLMERPLIAMRKRARPSEEVQAT